MNSGESVRTHTDEAVNEKIRKGTDRSIEYYSRHPDEIPERLSELEAEWDVDRVMEANASCMIISGLAMSIVGGKKWLLLPAVAGGCLLQQSLDGWSPPMSLLRRLGIRTRDEIDRERTALRALEGRFDDMAKEKDIGRKTEKIIESI